MTHNLLLLNPPLLLYTTRSVRRASGFVQTHLDAPSGSRRIVRDSENGSWKRAPEFMPGTIGSLNPRCRSAPKTGRNSFLCLVRSSDTRADFWLALSSGWLDHADGLELLNVRLKRIFCVPSGRPPA